MSITVTHEDLKLTIHLLASQLAFLEVHEQWSCKDGRQPWFVTDALELLCRLTGETVVGGCIACEGLGVYYQTLENGGVAEMKHQPCDGKGYHTPETAERRCAYCPPHERQDNPFKLERHEGVWVCDDEDCQIDHALAIRGLSNDRQQRRPEPK